jgi:hypothetical protein
LMDEDDPSADLQRGHPLEYMQIASLERPNNIPLTRGNARPRDHAWAS